MVLRGTNEIDRICCVLEKGVNKSEEEEEAKGDATAEEEAEDLSESLEKDDNILRGNNDIVEVIEI